MIILPFIFVSAVWRLGVLRGLEWREAMLAALVSCGTLVAVFTEILTMFSCLSFGPLVLLWGAACAAAVFFLLKHQNAFRMARPSLRLSPVEIVLLSGGGLIVLVTGFIAFYAPPNTWDSMTYHMSRVAHWAQNHGVMNYPTNIIRQLVYWPYAEEAVLNGVILSGGDYFANAVQWTALVGSSAGASLLARELGLSRLWQLATAVFVLTTPMVILQASSTQNDLLVALWAVATAVFSRRSMRNDVAVKGKEALLSGFLAALALGLAVLTKGSGGLLAALLLCAAVFCSTVDFRKRLMLPVAALAAVVALAGPFYGRLTGIDPSPVKAMAMGGNVTMGKMGVAETASNMVRNVATELASPWAAMNTMIVSGIRGVHQFLGLDMADPNTSSAPSFSVLYFPDEDYMPNPLHMLLVLLAAVLFWRVPGKSRFWWGMAMALGGAALIFCVTVRWQPWITRFHVPFFVLASPLVMAVLSKILSPKVLAGMLVVLLLAALHPLVANNTRRLVSARSLFQFSRDQLYFAKHGWEYPVVTRMTSLLRNAGCREVGVKINGDDWEYTWMRAMGQGARLEHVTVTNTSARFSYPLGDFLPCAVIALKEGDDRARMFNDRSYVQVARSGDFDLFIDPRWAYTHLQHKN